MAIATTDDVERVGARVGAILRRLREDAGLDQLTLAERAGISQQGISKIERGASIEPKTLPRICRVLNVSVDEVLAEAGADTLPLRRETGDRRRGVSRAPRSRWPFLLPYQRFEALTRAEKLHIEAVLIDEVARIEAAARPRQRAGLTHVLRDRH